MTGSRTLRRPLSDRPVHRVTAMRHARGWSMDDLAARANTNRQRICKTRLNEDWLRVLAAAFDVAPTDILPDDDQSVVLSPEERALIEAYRALPVERRPLIPGIIAGLGQIIPA
jgi:lambda repressor-like predicted transcriptional regulator